MRPAEGSEFAVRRVAGPGAGGVVARPELWERLGASARVTVVSAPPGSGKTVRSAFPGLRAQPRGKDTVLTGVLPDQAALYGILAEIEALGLELLEVLRI
jgi:hypothetical protein